MNWRSLIMLILVAAISIVLILIVQLSSVKTNTELRERIRTYQALHRIQLKQLENSYRATMAYVTSDNPKILKAVQEIQHVVEFQQAADTIIDIMIRHRNEPDSVSHYFNQYKIFINAYQPVYDFLCASLSSLDKRPVEQILLLEKLFGKEPSLFRSERVPDGRILYISLLNLRSDLYSFTLTNLWSLGAIADASSIRYLAEPTFSPNEPLLYTDCPVTLFNGKTERVMIQFSGQALAHQYVIGFKGNSGSADSLATTGRLGLQLIATKNRVEIKPLHRSNQYVSYIGYGVWEFDVTPLKTGSDTLYFRIDASNFKPPVTGEFSIPDYPLVITIQ